MVKTAVMFVCQSCGTAHPRWSGKCGACGEWNTLVEELAEGGKKEARTRATTGARVRFHSLESEESEPPRIKTGVPEFDRVVGGGLVAGSVVLLAGDPGVGKSTLLLQVAASSAAESHITVYVSGEEATAQLRLRARRLGLANAPLSLAATTALTPVVAALESAKPAPALLVVDSIQTMHIDDLDSAPGSVAQVRESAQALVRLAKKRGIAVVLIGHVTKDGMVAGPKVLEHLVDTVLNFEGERGGHFRILRASKNRFGPADEIGVWEMTSEGLAQSHNPSALFLGSRTEPVSGSAVFAGLEGSRPLLVEIQALVAPSPFGNPRRAVVGWDTGRLAQVLAVLESRCGLPFSQQDVYLNVAGGLRITEPAADLAVAAALISATESRPLPAEAVVFGELALSGEVRAVANPMARFREAARLGFSTAWCPTSEAAKKKRADSTTASPLSTAACTRIGDLVERIRACPRDKAASFLSDASRGP